MAATASNPSPLPQPETDTVDKNDPSVQSAINFLKDSRMRLTSSEGKIRFLKLKGLSPAQIKYAFDQAGQNIPLEKIVEVKPAAISSSSAQSGGNTASPSGPSASATKAASAPSRVSSLSGGGVAPARTHTLYPPTPYVPEPTPQSSWDWRDVVIGAGAAAIAAVGGAKLFKRYSPYEFRRKDDRAASLSSRQSMQGRRQQRRYNGAISSDTETDRGFGSRANAVPGGADGAGFGATSLRHPSPPPPLPQAPQGAAAAAVPDKDEEVKRLEKELADAKESLVGERKRNAELSLSVAKIRNEKQQLILKNDRLSQKVEDLEEQVKKLEEEKEKKPAEDEDKEEGETGEATEETGDAAKTANEANADAGDDAEVDGGDDVDNNDNHPVTETAASEEKTGETTEQPVTDTTTPPSADTKSKDDVAPAATSAPTAPADASEATAENAKANAVVEVAALPA